MPCLIIISIVLSDGNRGIILRIKIEELSLSTESLDDCSCTKWSVDVISNPNNLIPPPLILQQKSNLFKTRPPFDSLEDLSVDYEDFVKGDKRLKTEPKSTSFETFWVLKRVVDRVCEVKSFTREIFTLHAPRPVRRSPLISPFTFKETFYVGKTLAITIYPLKAIYTKFIMRSVIFQLEVQTKL